MSSTIAGQFAQDHAARLAILQEARLCAALVRPWILPPEGHSPSQSLPENFQSIGSRGLTNLEGRMLLALFPPDNRWFELSLSPEIKYDPEVDPATIQDLENRLFWREVLYSSLLEQSGVSGATNVRALGFRAQKRQAISQILVTGDVLEQLTDDYRVKVFRRDQYVTSRDTAGDVMYHIVREQVDMRSLSDEQLAKAGLKLDEIEAKPSHERLTDLFTHIEWHPRTNKWVIRQEVKDKQINESEDTVSPYFSTPFELVSGEHYGRGFIAQNKGDLRSLNALRIAMLDFAAASAKHLWVKDYSSMIKASDLAKPSGSMVNGRVSAGQVQDVACLSPNKTNDFTVVAKTAETIEQGLAAAMLMTSGVAPQGDRVTATAWNQVVQELEGALGGVYAPISEQMQLPLLRRVAFQAARDKIVRALPEKAVEIKTLTGLAALSRARRAQDLLTLSSAANNLGPEATAYLDKPTLMKVLARYSNVTEPGVVRSEQQVQEMNQKAMQMQTAQYAAQRGTDALGKITEQAAQRQIENTPVAQGLAAA